MFGFEKFTIFGRDSSPYMTRWVKRLSDGGSRRLHVFHRGDSDPDPHDHPADFWTFPLTDYYEEHFFPELSAAHGYVWRSEINLVKKWRWHFRPANYVHRVLDPLGGGRIVTYVRFGTKYRDWGFWVNKEHGARLMLGTGGREMTYEYVFLRRLSPWGTLRSFVPWREYLGLASGPATGQG